MPNNIELKAPEWRIWIKRHYDLEADDMMLRSYVGMKGTWCRCYDGWNYGLTDWSIGNKVNLMTPSWRISFFVMSWRWEKLKECHNDGRIRWIQKILWRYYKDGKKWKAHHKLCRSIWSKIMWFYEVRWIESNLKMIWCQGIIMGWKAPAKRIYCDASNVTWIKRELEIWYDELEIVKKMDWKAPLNGTIERQLKDWEIGMEWKAPKERLM